MHLDTSCNSKGAFGKCKLVTVSGGVEVLSLTLSLTGYRDFLHSLQIKMLVPRPLYLGLEWLSSTKKQEREYIEECIGEEVLSTILFRGADYDSAKKLLSPYPQIRIGTEKRIAESLPG